MPIRLDPGHSDPQSDLQTQLAAMGAILAGNLMTVAVLWGQLDARKHPRQPLPGIFDRLPKISTLLFLGTSLYFLALSRRDVKQQPGSLPLQAVFWANALSTVSVGMKTAVAFQALPGSPASVGSVEP